MRLKAVRKNMPQDNDNMKVTNFDEANQFVKRQYRELGTYKSIFKHHDEKTDLSALTMTLLLSYGGAKTQTEFHQTI